MVMDVATADVERECGRRLAGGLYLELTTGPGGAPLEDFLIDPPYLVDVQGMGIGAQGMKLVQVDGVWHLFDRVGKRHYPRVDMFLEEARRYGVSRRVPKNLDLSVLDPRRSKLVLVHEYAGIGVPTRYHARPRYDERRVQPYCPTGQLEHHDSTVPCIGLCWEDHEEGEKVTPVAEGSRLVTVQMKTFTYPAALSPFPGLPHQHAAFMSMPAARFVAVAGGSDKDQDALARIREKVTVHEVAR